jgi:anti-sigma-K factor RskA
MISHESMLESVAAYALGVLPPQEAGKVRAHLETCEECRAEYRDLAPAASALAYASEASPGPLLKRRLMAEVRSQARSPRTAVWPAYAAAAACLAVALGSSIYDASLYQELRSLRRDNAQLTAVLSQIAAPGSHGYRVAGGEVVRNGSHLYLAMNALPALPKGKVYQAWTLKAGAAAMTPSVTFVPNGSGVAVIALPVNASHLAAVAVSVEPAGGSKQPTSKPAFVLTFS